MHSKLQKAIARKNQPQIVLRRFKGDISIYQSAGNNNYSVKPSTIRCGRDTQKTASLGVKLLWLLQHQQFCIGM